MTGIPKFSIIVPVYNVEGYLGKCLDSALGQTMLDIEVICVDDGSEDGSADLLREYSRLDARVRIVTKENGGLSSARNAGMGAARGDYICFLDADDYVEPNLCERLYTEVLEHRPDVIAFGAHIFPLTKDTDPWTYRNLSPWTQHFRSFGPPVLLSANRGYPFVWRNCFRRGFLERKRLRFNERIRFGEDTVFQVCAFPGARDIIYIADKLYHYRYDREGSLMFGSRRDAEGRLEDHIEIVRAIAAYWEANGYLERWGALFAAFVMDFMGYDLLQYEGEGKEGLTRRLLAVMDHYGVGGGRGLPKQYRRVYAKLREGLRGRKAWASRKK